MIDMKEEKLSWQREFFAQAIELMAATIEKEVGGTAKVVTIREIREIIRTIIVPEMKEGWRIGDTASICRALADRYPLGYQ